MLTNFTSNQFPNTHIDFDSKGVRMVVTLNIPSKLRHFLSKNNVSKGEKHWVYKIGQYIEDPNVDTVKLTYNTLMQRAMLNCRDAKIRMIQEEKKNISERKIFY